METDKKIPCTVGIMTKNSARTLERALSSVANFEEIIICDGGSSDGTLEIAKKFGAHIIEQDPQFLDGDGKIIDFASVRNQMLNVARLSWFFYLDSDEYISHELRDEIRNVTSTCSEGVYVLYRRYVLGDGREVTCATTYPNPSVRLFARLSVERFIKKVHERIRPKEGTVPKELKGALYVPVGNGSGPGKQKGNHYIELEIQQIASSGKPFWGVFPRVALWHIAVSCKYILRLLYICIFCRGVKMPFHIEIERHRYHLMLIIGLWKNRSRFS